MEGSSGGSSGIKSRFITENEVAEAKLKRQQEWEEARKNGRDLPTEEPEAPVDYRSLYEKLQEQKIKKQEEHDEQFKFKNMIYKGLDQDESDFLAFAANQQAEFYAKRCDEESEELQGFRNSVNNILSKRAAEPTLPEKELPNEVKKQTNKSNVKTHKQLLSGLVRKKRSIDHDKSDSNAKETDSDVTHTPAKTQKNEEHSTENSTEAKETVEIKSSISSLAAYSDSSDDDTDADT